MKAIDKDALIAQLEAASASLDAQSSQMIQLQEFQGLAPLQNLQGPLSADGLSEEKLYRVITPSSLKSRRTSAKLYWELNPRDTPLLTWEQFSERYPNAISPGNDGEGESLYSPDVVPDTDEIPFFYKREDVDNLLQRAPMFTPQQIDELKNVAPVFTPEQIEQLSKEAAEAASSTQVSRLAELERIQGASVRRTPLGYLRVFLKAWILARLTLIELKREIKALVDEFVAEHQSENEDSSEDVEDSEE